MYMYLTFIFTLIRIFSSRSLDTINQFKGPWIVHLEPSITHEEFHYHLNSHYEKTLPFVSQKPLVTKKFESILHGVVVEGIRRADLLQVKGVSRAIADTKKKILRESIGLTYDTFTIPWGIDR